MATTVNARDVRLAAAATRVANMAMAPNLVLSPSQVTGLGIVIDGTKFVSLAATTQVFQIAKNGTVSPASTTLTANVRNLTNAPTLTVVSGTITPAPALVDGVVTIAHGAMTTNTATLRLTVTQDGKTYTDEMTLVKVREGIDALNGFLTNEAHTIPADSLGNPLSYFGAGGSFKVYQGANDVSSVCTYAIAPSGNPSALTVSLNAATGVYSVTGGYPVGTDLTTLTLRATFGTSALDKVFTISKAKAGQNGVTAKNITVTGAQTFKLATTGSWDASARTITATKFNGLTGTVVWSVVLGTYTGTLTGAGGAGTAAGTLSVSRASMTTDSVTFRATVTDGGETYADDFTLVKLIDGLDGVNAVSAYLTNESHTVPASATGAVTSWAGCSGLIRVFNGTTNVTAETTFAIFSNGDSLVCSVSAGGAYSVTGPGSWTDTDRVTLIVIRATYNGTTVDKTFTISKATSGVAGADGTDGANGANGADGVRGSRTFYVALSGTTATYSTTLATTTASVDGGPVRNDTVTQYNDGITPGFSETRFWDGTSWLVVNAIVDGNLLVNGTVGATALSANSVTADKLAANAVTADKIAASSITARELMIGDSNNLIPNWNMASNDVRWFNPLPSLANGIGISPITSGGAAFTNAPTTYVLTFAATTSENQGTYPNAANWIPCQAGEEFFVSTAAATTGVYTTNTFRMIVYWQLKDGTQSSANYYFTSMTSAWSVRSVDLIAPANAVGMRVRLFHNSGSGNTGTIVCSNFIARRKAVGTLLVNGTITATNLATDAVTADKIQANAVTADKIQADAVTADKIDVTSLSAVSATIGTLRTATTGSRMELMDNVIKIYDGSTLRVQLGNLSL